MNENRLNDGLHEFFYIQKFKSSRSYYENKFRFKKNRLQNKINYLNFIIYLSFCHFVLIN
jgi:hypothetical protein